MRTRFRRPLQLAAAALAVGVAAGCSTGGGDDLHEAFERDVVAARDKTDSAFAHIQRPTSTSDLVVRLRASRDEVAAASGEIGVAEAPEDLQDERRRLAGSLSDLAQEMDAAANSVELLIETPGRVERLVFEEWDAVQAALDALREEGIDVEPLQRRGGDQGS